MKTKTRVRLILTLLLIAVSGQLLLAEKILLLTWNISNLGGSKDDAELAFMANILQDYDVIALQEVVARDPRGAQAVGRLADELNRRGTRWDYRVSDPTRNPSAQMSERYAFLWKSAKIDLLGRPFLDSALAEDCIREPYIGNFRCRGATQSFFVVNFHYRVFSEHPELEITLLRKYQAQLGTERVFINGDFNLDEEHPVWEDFYAVGYLPAIAASPTTLKRKCNAGNYLNHAIDNIYYDRDVVTRISAGRIDFVGSCALLEQARLSSDHLPVYLVCELVVEQD